MSNSVLKNKDDEILNPKIPRYEKKVLWENSNPQGFSELNVNLSDGNYTSLRWYYYINLAAPDEMLIVDLIKGYGSRLITTNSAGGVYFRGIERLSDTSFKIGNVSPSTSTNTLLVPFKVVGIYS